MEEWIEGVIQQACPPPLLSYTQTLAMVHYYSPWHTWLTYSQQSGALNRILMEARERGWRGGGECIRQAGVLLYLLFPVSMGWVCVRVNTVCLCKQQYGHVSFGCCKVFETTQTSSHDSVLGYKRIFWFFKSKGKSMKSSQCFPQEFRLMWVVLWGVFYYINRLHDMTLI